MDPITMGIAGGTMALGGIGSAWGGHNARTQANKNIGAARSELDAISSRIPGQSEQIIGDLQTAYSPYTQNAAGDMDSYRLATGQIGNLQYGVADPFAYDLNTQAQQFLDPTVDYQTRKATEAVEGSAANRGKLFSSATGKAISDRAQEIAQQSWKDAMAMALQDRGFQYGVYSDDVQRDRANIDLALKQQGMKLDSLGNLAGMGQDATTNLASSVAGVQGDMFSALNEADIAKANLLLNKQDTGWGSIFGDFASGMGGSSALMGTAMMGGK